MKISKEKQLKLKKLLNDLSSDSEKEELAKLDAYKVKQIVNAFEEEAVETETNYGKLLEAFGKFASASQKHSQMMKESFDSLITGLSDKLEGMAGKITTSYEKNKPFNAAGVYKDMINQLSAIKKGIDDKPVPVWNWPQYASVGVRNKNFSNINPAQNDQATSIGVGTRTVSSAGTAVQVSSSSIPCVAVYIQAHESNTNPVVVGDSNVVAALSGRKGLALYPTNSQKFVVSDVSMLWVDAVTSGDKINYYYEVA